MNRVALVTGAGRGIGAATVITLVERGWSVVAVDRCSDDPRLPYALATEDDLDAVVKRTSEPKRVLPIIADATNVSRLTEAVDAAERAFGGLDAMIVAAGVIAGGVPVWELPPEQEEAVLEVNLKGAIVAARVGIPALLRRPEPRAGRFIVVASAAATRGLPLLGAYCAAKAGVTGLVRALAAELGGTGVTANAINPGSTATEIIEESARLYGLESGKAFAAQQPLKRLIEPIEIAAAIAWLADAATQAVTGVALPVDGGLAL